METNVLSATLVPQCDELGYQSDTFSTLTVETDSGTFDYCGLIVLEERDDDEVLFHVWQADDPLRPDPERKRFVGELIASAHDSQRGRLTDLARQLLDTDAECDVA